MAAKKRDVSDETLVEAFRQMPPHQRREIAEAVISEIPHEDFDGLLCASTLLLNIATAVILNPAKKS